MTRYEIDTPFGPARAEVHLADEGRAALLLGHGAGGGVTAPDLVAAARIAAAEDVHVALIEQPYRVAGRRAPAPAHQLAAARPAVVEDLGERSVRDVPLTGGGRSPGARAARRTGGAGAGSAGLCLAFPVHPPGKPEKSRTGELGALDIPVLVVQGERDAFGRPDRTP